MDNLLENVVWKKDDRLPDPQVRIPFNYQGKDYEVAIDFDNGWMQLSCGHTQTLAHMKLPMDGD